MKQETKNALHKFLNTKGFRVILLGLSGTISGCIFINYQNEIIKYITRYMSEKLSIFEVVTALADTIIVFICMFLAILMILTTISVIIDKLLVSNKKEDH